MAEVVGGEHDRVTVGREPRLDGPAVDARGVEMLVAGLEVDDGEVDVDRRIRPRRRPAQVGEPTTVGREGRAPAEPVVARERAALAGLAIDDDDVVPGRADVVASPGRRDRAAVRADGDLGFGQGRTGRTGQVLDLAEGRVGVGRRVGHEQPRLARPEVVVPIAQRVGLVEAGLHAGIRARLVAFAVRAEVADARVEVGNEPDRARVPRHDEPVDPGRRGEQQACLTTLDRELPQGGRRLVRRVLGVGIGARRREQQGTVGQEVRAALAGGRSGQPTRRRLAGRVELPDRARAGPCGPGRAWSC